MDFEKQSIEILQIMASNSGIWVLDSGGKDSSILKDENTGYLQVVKEIEKLYEEVSKPENRYSEFNQATRDFKRYTDSLPPEAWIQ